jgi:hypothetical protein
VIEIANFRFTIDHVCNTLQEHGLELERLVSPGFGEAERPIFRSCGKEHLFEQSQPEPAIFIGFFRREIDLAGGR